jgi:G3E family GTPase
MEVNAAITVDVLTGFLGAGKTSLLRRLLASGVLADTALLINEFADTAVDRRLLDSDGALTQAFAQGCLCCAIDGNLRDGLLDLLGKRASGVVPPFGRIVVETSGMADPAGLIATIAMDPRLRHRLRFGNTVTMIDVANFAETISSEEVALAQLAVADRIIFSKCDMAGPDLERAARAAVTRINPIAAVSTMIAGEWTGDPWRNLTPQTSGKRPMMAIASEGARHGEAQALTIRRSRPVDWPSLAVWLSLLAHRHGGRILRIKGFADIPGCGPILIQGVRHLVCNPEHLPASFKSEGLELVMIMRALDPLTVRRSFEAFVESAATLASSQRSFTAQTLRARATRI